MAGGIGENWLAIRKGHAASEDFSLVSALP
jgi:hypothetical protein